MDTLTPAEEEQMISAVKRAVDLVDDEGMTPDQAMLKIAREHGYGRGQIEFLCAGYNTGRQTDQRIKQANILAKLKPFPLADSAAVVRELYSGPKPVEKTASVHEDYLTPPTFLTDDLERASALTSLGGTEKTASVAAPVDPPKSFHRLVGEIEREKRAGDEAGRKASNAEDRVRGHVCELVGYFKKFAADRIPFATFEKIAEMYRGDVIKPLIELVYNGARLTEKRAGDSVPLTKDPINWHAMPYSALDDCVKFAKDVHAHRQTQTKHVEKTAQLQEAVLRPFHQAADQPPPRSSLAGSPLYSEKVAGIFGTPAGIAVGSLLGRAMDDVPTKQKLVEDAGRDLDDPAHQNEIRKIRTQAMLTGMMSDPDDPISGYDPETVLSAYNELSQMAPHTADQPAALRPLLRRRLEGHTEPFEAKELTDIEKGLSPAKSPSIMPNVPQSIIR